MTRLNKLLPTERSQVQEPNEFVWPITKHPEECHHIRVGVVIDLYRAGPLAEEDRRRAAERLDIALVRAIDDWEQPSEVRVFTTKPREGDHRCGLFKLGTSFTLLFSACCNCRIVIWQYLRLMLQPIQVRPSCCAPETVEKRSTTLLLFTAQNSVTGRRTVFRRDVNADVMSSERLGDNGGGS